MFYHKKSMKIRRGSAGAAIVLTVIIALAAFAVPVSAHELSTDHGISAELHVPPLDKPIAGQLTSLQFSFEDMPATFSLPECDCRVQASGPVETPLVASTQTDNSDSSILTSQMTFPKAGSYTITLSGFTTSAQKTRFSLSYPVHVGREPVTVGPTARVISGIMIIVCAVATAGILVYYFMNELRKPHAKA